MTTTKTPFAGKAESKREQTKTRFQSAEREQARRFSGRSTSGRLLPTGRKNGLSRTAMVFKIATVAGHKLTVTELNRIKDINPRALERVYDSVVGAGMSKGDALFALKLVLK